MLYVLFYICTRFIFVFVILLEKGFTYEKSFEMCKSFELLMLTEFDCPCAVDRMLKSSYKLTNQ